MKNKYVFVTVMLAVLLFLGVGLTEIYVNHTEEKEDGQYTVVTSFYPMYIAALNVVGENDHIRLENLSEPQTGCLHDYQLSTGDMKVLNKADVFLINGAGMESYLTRVMDTFPKLPVVDASAGITLLTEDGMDEYVDDHDHDHDRGYDRDQEYLDFQEQTV